MEQHVVEEIGFTIKGKPERKDFSLSCTYVCVCGYVPTFLTTEQNNTWTDSNERGTYRWVYLQIKLYAAFTYVQVLESLEVH